VEEWARREPLYAREPGTETEAIYAAVTPGFFDTLGLVPVGGSLFDQAAGLRTNIAVLSRTLAQQLFAPNSAVGRRVSLLGATGPWLTVVGVANDVTYGAVDRRRATIYVPYPADPWPLASVVVKARALPGIEEFAHRIIGRYDIVRVVGGMRKVNELVDLQARRWRSLEIGLSSIAILNGMFSVVGMYSASYVWWRHVRRDVAIRMALGAGPYSVMRSYGGRIGAALLLGNILGGVVGLFCLPYLHEEAAAMTTLGAGAVWLGTLGFAVATLGTGLSFWLRVVKGELGTLLRTDL
jgi:hypothetical protein